MTRSFQDVACLVLVALATFSVSGACQAPDELAELRERILQEFDRTFQAKVAELRRELRAELSEILDRAGEQIRASGTSPQRRPEAQPDRPGRDRPNPDRPGLDRPGRARPEGDTPVGERAYLGIKSRELKPGLRSMLEIEEGVGLVVEDVRPDSPAAAAGLERHDVLVSVRRGRRDTKITGEEALRGFIARCRAGDRVEFTVLRKGETLPVVVELGTRGTTSPPVEQAPVQGDGSKTDEDLDELLEELLAEKSEPGGDDVPAPGDSLRDRLPPEYREMFETEEGREMLRAQVESFNLLLDTPEGRDLALMQVEGLLNRFANEQGISDEEFDHTMELVEEFMERDYEERRQVIEGFMQMMVTGENPFDGLERLLGKSPDQATPEDLDSFLDDLLEKEHTPGFLGVTPENASEELQEQRGLKAGGAFLRGVHAEGPAAAAGVEPGDVVTAVDGKPVADRDALIMLITSAPAGQEVELTLVNEEGKTRKLKVKLGERSR